MDKDSKKKFKNLAPEITVSKKPAKAPSDTPSAPRRLTDDEAVRLLEDVFGALEAIGLTGDDMDPATMPSEKELQEALAALLPEGSGSVTVKLVTDHSLLMNPQSPVPDYIQEALDPLSQEDVVQRTLRQRAQKSPSSVVSGPKTLQ